MSYSASHVFFPGTVCGSNPVALLTCFCRRLHCLFVILLTHQDLTRIAVSTDQFWCTQIGQDWLPFLEGLSALTSRLPTKEAAVVVQHLQNTARPLKPSKNSREWPQCLPHRFLLSKPSWRQCSVNYKLRAHQDAAALARHSCLFRRSGASLGKSGRLVKSPLAVFRQTERCR